MSARCNFSATKAVPQSCGTAFLFVPLFFQKTALGRWGNEKTFRSATCAERNAFKP
jgi:hypothetical protein